MTTITETPLPLYPFQRKAIDRMKGSTQKGFLLFDDMGLGKTRQTLTVIEEANLFPCLIIPPKTLSYNWWDEVEKWFPDRGCSMFEDAESFLNEYMEQKADGVADYFIMWHDVLARFEKDELLEIIGNLKWGSIVVDEAHLFRNSGTLRTESLMKFKHGKRIVLTGTPIVNSALDLQPLLEFTGFKISPKEFEDRYVYMRNTPNGRKPSGFRNREGLMEIVGDSWIRRTKAQVLKDLPPKTIQTMKLRMPPDQAKAYSNLVTMMMIELEDGEIIETPNVLSLLTRMRQLTLDPRIVKRDSGSAKTEAIKEIFKGTQGKIVVFSNFAKYINLLHSELTSMGINTVKLTGDENGDSRLKIVKDFNTDPNIQGFLGTMQAGGVGINLTSASTVIITDYWWNQARIDQAIDRCHRIGQENNVLAIILHCVDSIDDHIEGIIKTKDATAKAIVNAIKDRGF